MLEYGMKPRFRTATIDDVQAITSLFAPPNLGADNITSEEALNLVTDKRSECFVADREGQIVGAISLSQVTNKSLLSMYVPVGQDSVFKNFPVQEPSFGFIKAVAVDKDARGKNIGTQLVLKSLDWFSHHHLSSVAVFAWEYDGFSAESNLWVRNGFQLWQRIPRFWYQKSLSGGPNYCLRCGKPCSCAVLVYVSSSLV